MRIWLLSGIAALAAGSAGMALAQTVKMGPAGAQLAPASQNQIVQLQQQIDALKAQVAQQANTIQGMKNQAQQIAIGGFANKGDLSILDKRVTGVQQQLQSQQGAQQAIAAGLKQLASQFGHHTHFSTLWTPGPTGNGRMSAPPTTGPADFCQFGGSKTADIMAANYKCSSPYP